jgi:alpha-galactosidase/6-phospho-beta-glucosidase family protein
VGLTSPTRRAWSPKAVYRHTSFKRFIGVCNIPIGMKMFITDVLQLSPSDELNIDLFGLNHWCSSRCAGERRIAL